MLKTFNEFICEARGFSETAGEYADLVKKEIDKSLDRYLSFKFKKGFVNFSPTIKIRNAFSKVSHEAAIQFPIDQIKILFRIAGVKPDNRGTHTGHYKSNYNKYKLLNGVDQKINIEILCRIYLPIDQVYKLDRKMLDTYLNDILYHEFTHALQDYRNPNFLKNYRLGHSASLSSQMYPEFLNSPKVEEFFNLLYVLTDEEISAIAGERREFKTEEEFNNYEGTRLARLGKEYDPLDYFLDIRRELKEFGPEMIINFGKIFVNIYKKSAKNGTQIDPNVIGLDSANLKQVLQYFEPYIKTQADKLFRKLVSKISAQGSGEII